VSNDAPRRLHPISPFFELIAGVRQLVIPVGAAAVAGQWWFIAPAVIVVAGRCISWFRFTYQLDGDVVRINEGLFVRKQRTIALDRVQQVDIVSKLRHRVFGVVGLHVDTASGARGAELKLEVVSVDEAARLRSLLTRDAPAAPVTDDREEEPVPAVVSLTVPELALAGMTGAQTLVILSLVYTAQEILDFVDVGRVRRLIPEGAESQPAAIAGAVVILALLWLMLAAASLVLTHYRYTLTTAGDQFRVTRGLLDRREVGGALNRVQAVRIEQSFIRRLLGFAAVRVQTAAVPGQEVSRVVIPYVPIADVERVVRALVPSLPTWPALRKAPRVALTLGLLRRVLPTVAVAAAVAVLFWPWGALALLLIPLSIFFGTLHWTALGYAWSDGTVWARRGGLFRETVIVPAAKAQSLRSSASALQRRGGVASLRIEVAGRGATPRVQDAPITELETIMAAIPAAAAVDERSTRLVKTAVPD
jgi:putative membrane protein